MLVLDLSYLKNNINAVTAENAENRPLLQDCFCHCSLVAFNSI